MNGYGGIFSGKVEQFTDIKGLIGSPVIIFDIILYLNASNKTYFIATF